MNIDDMVQQLTREEKIALCSGNDAWSTKPVERLSIPSIHLSDGPHGLRKEVKELGLFKAESIKATCFPTASALGATWNKDLIYEVGAALGCECQSSGVDIILGPGVNMKRTPFCGRNFEYFSEDPVLTGHCAIAYVNGVQSQGVGVSVKHFACNNQEYQRFSIDVVVDERTLRELYLKAFEMVVKKAAPWTIMSSYNKLNGEFVSESRRLLTNILRNEWGFTGVVVSDWGSIYDRVSALRSGCQLEMPGNNGRNDHKLIKSLDSGELEESALDEAVKCILDLAFKVKKNMKKVTCDTQAHHLLARKAALESIVLLKNEDNILPLVNEKIKRIAVIGEFARNPRIQGEGSSRVNPVKVDIPLEEIRIRAGGKCEVLFNRGYTDDDTVNETLLAESRKCACSADVAIIFLGLPDKYESEGFDRTTMRLPESHVRLVEEVSIVQKNTVVILSCGSAVTMPWCTRVKAIMLTWLEGQGGGGACADILFGSVSPSGRLSETFPEKIEHNPAHIHYPGEKGKVRYGEGVFIGYRYYEKKRIEPLFPFGFGLSYTHFDYISVEPSATRIKDTDTLVVKVRIKNTGNMAAKEVIQLYVRDCEATVCRPEKELAAFDKIELGVGEEKEAVFQLDKSSFSFYDVEAGAWTVETGDFLILIGKSSQDIKLSFTVHVESTEEAERRRKKRFTGHTLIGDILRHPVARKILKETIMEKSSGTVDIEKLDKDILTSLQTMPLIKLADFMSHVVTEELVQDMISHINSNTGRE
jgi:beta-glucosidase